MGELPDDNVEVITIESEDELQFWEDQDSVEYIEADTKIYLQGESTPWGINTVEALDVSDANVSNQKVCIIDTGYDASHPDLPTSVTGTSQISGQSWRVDGAGHGTHVAGTIAAIGGNNQGVVGVNRNGKLKLHIVKVFDNNGFWTWGSDLIKAVESCVSAGSTVVNMSLGGGGFLRAEKDAYDRVYNQNGVLIVASSGNSGTTDKSYPASYPAVISVGATDQNNQKADFSQYNDQVDLCAPGVGVKSTVPGGGYKKYDGTSMSAPHVAGVAALVWNNFPNKSAQEIREALESSAQDLGSPGRDNKYGHGLVRADLAYNFLLSNGGGGGNPAQYQLQLLGVVIVLTVHLDGMIVMVQNSIVNGMENKTDVQSLETNFPTTALQRMKHVAFVGEVVMILHQHQVQLAVEGASTVLLGGTTVMAINMIVNGMENKTGARNLEMNFLMTGLQQMKHAVLVVGVLLERAAVQCLVAKYQ